MTGAGPRLAVNPIAYWLVDGKPDKSTATLGAALAELADIGYRAVKADVPVDMDTAAYLPWLESFGLTPAVSLFNGSFDDPAQHRAQTNVARAYAEQQAVLGQRVCMISTCDPPGSLRRRHPAIGADFDPDRLAVVVDGVAACCRAMQDVGVKAILHPHVGGWIETEDEVRTVLDSVDAALLGFGPDTGHMSWAGMDVSSILSDYADRVEGIHLKDTLSRGVADAAARDLDYAEATRPGRLWAEPGCGDVDLADVVDVLRGRFHGDYMIEVDVPTMPLRRCHEVAYDWALRHLDLGS